MSPTITTRREIVPGDFHLPRVETVIFENGRFVGFSDYNTPISELSSQELAQLREFVTTQTAEFVQKRKEIDALIDACEKAQRGPALFENVA